MCLYGSENGETVWEAHPFAPSAGPHSAVLTQTALSSAWSAADGLAADQ